MKTGEAIRKRIKELRLEQDMSEYRLIRRSLLAPSTIKSVLKQKSKDPRVSTVTLICDALGITIREFYNSPLFEDPDMAGLDALDRE